MHIWPHLPFSFGSSFLLNDGGQGGVVSTSYVPVAFGGNNTFLENRGTSLTVSGVRTSTEPFWENGSNFHTYHTPWLLTVQYLEKLYVNGWGIMAASWLCAKPGVALMSLVQLCTLNSDDPLMVTTVAHIGKCFFLQLESGVHNA